MSDCVVCQRRPPATPLVCDGCRRRLDVDLSEIVDLYALLPAALEPTASTGQRVSGSREAPTPVRVDVLDLALPLRGRELVHDPKHDQTGHTPVVWVLNSWVRDWRETLWPDHHQPAPTVVTLAGWLRDRLDAACDRHPAVDEFAAEMREQVGALRSVLGHVDPKPELCEGVECARCDLRMLYRRSDGTGWVDCRNPDCQRVYTADEYAEWVALVAAHVDAA